jgi:hypothetical protein
MVAKYTFWRKRVRTGQRWDAGVGVGSGLPGSSAKARRSLAIAKPCEFRVSPGGEAVVSNTAYVLVADSYCKLL